MPWPTQVWDPQHDDADAMGMVGFTPPMDPGEAYLSRKGLSPEVYFARPNIKDPELSVWDAMESPFFKAMYELEPGRNWDDFKAAFDREIGAYEDQDFRIQTGTRTWTETERGSRKKEGGWSTREVNKSEPIYRTFNGYQAAVDWVNGNDYLDVDDIELAAQPEKPFDPDTDDDDYRFWGINDKDWESIFNEMVGQGIRIQKRFDLQDAPIIREGPKASDYGIDAPNDNIFTYYDLDTPHTGPEELQWANYKWNLKSTWTSNVTYAVPPGLRRVNLHGDDELGWQPRPSLRDRIQTPSQEDPWRTDQVAEATGEPIT